MTGWAAMIWAHSATSFDSMGRHCRGMKLPSLGSERPGYGPFRSLVLSISAVRIPALTATEEPLSPISGAQTNITEITEGAAINVIHRLKSATLGRLSLVAVLVLLTLACLPVAT